MKKDISTLNFRKKAADLVNVSLPHDQQLEELVIGTCLIETTAFARVKRYLSATGFFMPKLRTVFAAMERLMERNEPIDLITVSDELRKKKLLMVNENGKAKPELVNPADLVDYSNRVASSAHLEKHCRILCELFMRRRAIKNAFRFIELGQDTSKCIFETYDLICKQTRATIPSKMLVVESMNDSLKKGELAERKKFIIGNLLKENEVVFLYGDEGTGKSVLAVQMGDAASQGKNLFEECDDPGLVNECEPLPTILIDFELENDELFDRYSSQTRRYQFHKNFHRASLNPDFLDFENADELIINEIQTIVETCEPKLLIIDNITYITSESQDPAIATKFMKRLIALQRTFKLSILVIAHTPKRDMSLPIESRHLSGAKNLSNFAKSLIAVSTSKQDPEKRYIKHVKCRNGRKIHGEDNVIECVLNKPQHSLFLQYEFYGFSTEKAHLQVVATEEAEREAVEKAATLIDKEGFSYRSLVTILQQEFGLKWSHMTIKRKVCAYKAKYDLENLPAA
jgi:RecA-family ATPase